MAWQDTQALMTKHINANIFQNDPLSLTEEQYNNIDVTNKEYVIELKNRERYTPHDFNGSFIEKIKFDGLVKKAEYQKKIPGYIVRFSDGSYYAWNLTSVAAERDLEWRSQLLPRNTHFGDNQLIPKKVADLYLNEAKFLFKEQSND
jgi:hypothetical protein